MCRDEQQKEQVRTTVVGSFPKPAYLGLPDWFSSTGVNEDGHAGHLSYDPTAMTSLLEKADQDPSLLRAIDEAVDCQCRCGLECITDGEMARENYIHHFCRQIEGISFEDIRVGPSRGGACPMRLPTIIGEVSGPADGAKSCVDEFLRSKAAADRHGKEVKFTLPGPMTIMDTVADSHYGEDRRGDMCLALAKIIRVAAEALVAAGCTHLQIDEPLYARKPVEAVQIGLPALQVVLDGLQTERTVHICCGYPQHLDQEDYVHADKQAYVELAEHIDACPCIDVVSLEDAHRHNDLKDLLPRFQRITVCFGAVAIAKSRVESVEEIEARLREVLQHLPRSRLIVAPDCGLGFLPLPILEAKLANMCAAVRKINADAPIDVGH